MEPHTSSTAQERVTALVILSSTTQAQWALRLGLSAQAVNDRVRARTRWSLEEAARIARHEGVSLDDVIGDDDLPTESRPLEAVEVAQ